MMSVETLAKKMTDLVSESQDKGTKPYDTTAEVVRIDGDIAWCHFAGGIDETPVQMTISAKVGDRVHVRVSGGTAWITGNGSAPPTDDATATQAMDKAGTAEGIAVTANEVAEKARISANRAIKIAGDTDQYFWHVQTGTDTGTHITEIPKSEFLEDPNNGGGNLLARSNGLSIRNGLTEMAQFTSDRIVLGISNDLHVEITPTALAFFSGDDTLGHINISAATFSRLCATLTLEVNRYALRETPSGALGVYVK